MLIVQKKMEQCVVRECLKKSDESAEDCWMILKGDS